MPLRYIIQIVGNLLPLVALLLLAGCEEGKLRISPKNSDSVSKPIVEPFGPIDTTLHDEFRKIEARSGGRLGVAAIHLESGWRTSYRGRETFPMASVGKLPMAIRFLRLVDSGAFRLDSTVTMRTTDHRPGSSLVYHRAMRAGGTTTLHALLEAMIAVSDNTASDYLLRLSGGPEPVDRLMQSLGLDGIDVTHDEGSLILLWAGVDPTIVDSAWTRNSFYERIEAAGDTAWRLAEMRLVDEPADASPPEQMAQLLGMLQRRTILGATTTDTLLAIMKRAVTGKGRILGLLPDSTPVAHKTGTISSTANDVGIVTLPGGRGHLAIAVFVKGSRVGVRARERAIAVAAQLVYRRIMEGLINQKSM